MRSRNHPQGSTALVAIIKMKADGHKLLEQRLRRLHEEIALFLRPTGVRRTIDTIGHWDAQVLMKRNEPVVSR
jgi:hypothetical protein